MSCSDLSKNLEIKTATNNILNNIYNYTKNDIYKPNTTKIFSDNFITQYSNNNINTDLDNIEENEGKENLATIDDDNVYINCVYQSSLPWYTTSDDKKKCIITPNIDLPENRLILDKKTLTVTPVFKSSNKDKPASCSYAVNVNKAYCENRWYDWIITPNYYLGNTYYKDTSHYGENDVYKCYAPCDGDFMPYTKTNGELKCIPKKYFNSGIFSNKYIFSSFGLINLIGNIALQNEEKELENTNLLYILHRLIFEYNLENNYDKEIYTDEKNNAVKDEITIFKKDNYINLYNEFKDVINKNILSKFSTSTNQDYSNTNEFTYKHRKFNEDETDMYSFNGLDVCNILIDPILIHTWMLANLFQPLNDTIIRDSNINEIIYAGTDKDKIATNKRLILESLLYEKLYVIFEDKDKAIRLKNIFFKAVNICYNGKTNFSINIIEKTKNAFTNTSMINTIIENKYYNFNKNIFFYNNLFLANSASKPSAYPFPSNLDNDEVNYSIYKNYINYILIEDRINNFKEYPLYKDVEITEFKSNIEKTVKDNTFKYNDLFFNNWGEEVENIWKFKYYYSMERLEKPTCENGYEWNETYKVCDLKKKKDIIVDNKDEEDDFQIPELNNILILFVKMILLIIILYIIYIFYDIFSEVIFSFYNAVLLGLSYMYMKLLNNTVTGDTEYDKEEKKLENEKRYIENKYKNMVDNDLKIENYIETHQIPKDLKN